MLKEFKEFAMKGNVMDLAVGVIIGGAFGKIVDSLVGDVIMPVISAITISWISTVAAIVASAAALTPADAESPEARWMFLKALNA